MPAEWGVSADDAAEVDMLFNEYIGLKRELKPDPKALAEDLRKANDGLRDEMARKHRKWNSELALGANLARGNSDTTLLNLGFKTGWKSGPSKFDLALDASYEEADGDNNLEKGELAANFNHDLTKRAFFITRLNAEHDEKAALDYRMFLAPGLGLKHAVGPAKISGSAGPAFVREEFKDEAASDKISALLTQEFEWCLNSRLKLFQGLKLLADVTDVDDYILTLDGGAESELYRRLFFRLGVKNVCVNRPAAGKDRNDFSLRTSLVWKF